MAVQRYLSPKIVLTIEDPSATRASLEALHDALRDDAQAVWTTELQARGHSRIGFERDDRYTIAALGGNLYQLYVKFYVLADPGYRQNDWEAVARLVRDQMVATARRIDSTRPVKEVYWNDAGTSTTEKDVTR